MAYPSIKVEIAFSTDPLAVTPTYTDVTDYVKAIPLIRRGRQNPLTGIEAGEATVVLDNRDRRFDPTYASSPYYPNVVPVRKIRISATYSAVTYRLFTGFIRTWPPAWEVSNRNSEVTLQCVDGFLFLNQATLTTTLSAEFINYAVGSLLTAVGWPALDRQIYSGQSFAKMIAVVNKSALQHLDDLTTAENGLAFVDGRGYLVWQNRHYRLTQSAALVSQGTFGDGGGGELPYQVLEPAYDDSQIYNDVHVTADGGTEQIASDSTSQASYFKRTLTRSGLLYGDATFVGGSTPDNEAAGMAQWLLYNYKSPALRFDRMTVEGGVDNSLWPQMLARGLSDRITVKRRPPPSGSTTITKDVMIEAIEHRITDITASYLRWQTTFQLSEANTQSWWILDDTTYSVLDSTTIPAF